MFCSPTSVCGPKKDPFEEEFRPREMPKKPKKQDSLRKSQRAPAKSDLDLGKYAPISFPKASESEKMCKKRRRIIDELISTEETYVENLRRLQSNFVKPLKKTGVLEKADLKSLHSMIFTPMKRMLVFHEEFLTELKMTESIPEVFKKRGDFLKMNNDFCSRHPEMLTELSRIRRENSAFDAFLKESEKKKLSIQSLLILPIQRVPRYKMLLEDLLKKTQGDHKQRPGLEEAVDHIQVIASQINEYQRNVENMNELYDISTKIRGRSDSLWKANRRFLWKEPCWRKSDTSAFKEAKLGFWFLFSDVIIVVSEAYKFRRELCLVDIDEITETFLPSHTLRTSSSRISTSKGAMGEDDNDSDELENKEASELTSPKRAPNLYGLQLTDRANPERPCTLFATSAAKREKWQDIIKVARDDLEQEMQEGVKNRLFSQPENGKITTIFMKMGTKVFVAKRMKTDSSSGRESKEESGTEKQSSDDAKGV